MAEVVGIELLKKLVKEFVDLGKVVVEQAKDGFTTSDLWPILMEGRDLTFVFSNWSDIRVEFNDLTKEETKELVDGLVVDLALETGVVLEVIEASIDFAEAGYLLFLAVKALTPPAPSV